MMMMMMKNPSSPKEVIYKPLEVDDNDDDASIGSNILRQKW
jgi:hypothetical protein